MSLLCLVQVLIVLFFRAESLKYTTSHFLFFFTEILCCVSYLFPWLQLAYKSPVSRVITVKIIVASDRHGYQGS